MKDSTTQRLIRTGVPFASTWTVDQAGFIEVEPGVCSRNGCIAGAVKPLFKPATGAVFLFAIKGTDLISDSSQIYVCGD